MSACVLDSKKEKMLDKQAVRHYGLSEKSLYNINYMDMSNEKLVWIGFIKI